MIGTVVQAILYTLFAVTITTAVAGAVLTWHASQGRDVNLAFPLTVLALIAAAAPYIGLFGTVWHIIQSLSGIGGGNLNVAAIARPIGQALYATLWGLGCAIPALIAHRTLMYCVPDEDVTPTAEGK